MVIFLCLFFWLSGLAWGVESALEGTFWTRGALDLRDDRPGEDLATDHQFLLLQGRFGLGPKIDGRLGLKIDRLADHRHGRHREEAHLWLWETYLRYAGEALELTIGSQIIRWGKADEISLLDNLTRQDLRELFTLRDEERRRPWPWLRVQYFAPDLTLEGVFTIFPLWPLRRDFDSDWAGFDHLSRRLKADPVFYRLSLDLKKKKPSPSLRNAEFGLRVQKTWGSLDLALSFLHAHNRSFYYYVKSFPLRGFRLKHPSDPLKDLRRDLAHLSLTGDRAVVSYPQDNILGFSCETTWSGLGLRAEVAYHTSRVFLKKDLTSTQKPYLRYLLGLDYRFENGLYLNFQFLTQHIGNYNREILFDPEWDTYLFWRLAKGFWRDFLEIRCDTTYGVSTRSYYLNPEVSYKPKDAWEIFLGLHLIDGPRGTFFDPYDANDQVYLGIKVSF